MPEIQSAPQNNTQTTQRFIEFVMMQAQQAALCLGQIPHPATGETIVNIEGARLFIDHLELIREKTRGNLSKEEESILSGIISELQLAFVQASQNTTPLTKEKNETLSVDNTDKIIDSKQSQGNESSSETEESTKRFSKSYGA